jgi:hypothetical protein
MRLSGDQLTELQYAKDPTSSQTLVDLLGMVGGVVAVALKRSGSQKLRSCGGILYSFDLQTNCLIIARRKQVGCAI